MAITVVMTIEGLRLLRCQYIKMVTEQVSDLELLKHTRLIKPKTIKMNNISTARSTLFDIRIVGSVIPIEIY